ncbi:MAG: VWA domain-containing protein, partial [bacterium]
MLTILRKQLRGVKGGLISFIIFALVINMSLTGVFFVLPDNVLADDALCNYDLDVVLVMDRSGSMVTGTCKWWWPTGEYYKTNYDVTEQWCEMRDDPNHPITFTPNDPSKLQSSKDSANTFLGLMGTNDQSALVSYASDVTLDKSLSNDHSATQAAVNSLSAEGATNIGDAIDLGNQELTSGRDQSAKVMILLTDGKANKPNGNGSGEDPADVAYAEAKAAEALALGYKIFTIGFNGDVNETMLQNIANITGGEYYFAPTSDDLEDVYNSISTKLCEYGSISGCKYDDVNNNGVIDDGEDTIIGWPIYLTNGNTNLDQETDQDGCYQFSGLLPGSYTISEGGTGIDFVQTYPTGDLHNIELLEGEDLVDYDFANYLPICGNEILDSDFEEVCEIGNTQTCDGGIQTCLEDCSGWSECIIGEPVCGNGILEDGEECDDSNTDDGDGCSSICQIEEAPPVCGNGILENGEECDDGNTEDGDGCSASCSIEYTNGGIEPGDIIINELMWMGTETSSTDEWLELRNMTNDTVDLTGCDMINVDDDTIISVDDLSGYSIPANSYLVISRKNIDDSNINTETQDILNFFALNNTELQIKLVCDEEIIDTAGDGLLPLDGDNGDIDDIKKSMQRKVVPGDGTVADSWCTASTQVNWDQGATDLGTPGAINDCGAGDYGSISGYKYSDADGDQVTEDWTGLSDWIINLFNSSDVDPISSTTTDQSGYFEFINLIPGEYMLTEDLLDSWTQLLNPGSIHVIGGISSEMNNFVNHYTGGNGEEPYCGDGIKNNDEQCDGSDLDEQSCSSKGYDKGTLTCNSDCTFNISECANDNGGGGGGGGGHIPGLIISNEQGALADGTEITITWNTNKSATSRVIYDTVSHSDITGESAPNYGYAWSTEKDETKVTGHSVTITGLDP